MRIRRSELDWTLVRPGVLTSGTKTGRYRVLDEPFS
ncbi:NAD(P)H-binding protein [Methylobacterium sp. BE186]|nr:NAD(P)H-binding protein [Methylobacterium sp. BE186]